MDLRSRFLPRRRGRPHLVLHVGTHKTGTTSIQSALRDNRDALARTGICYPDPTREPHPHLPAHNFIYRATLNGPAAMAAERDLIMAEFKASRADCLVLSEEGLSLPRDELQAFFTPWRDIFDFQIVCFLRRQDRYAESLFSQYVREGKPIAEGTITNFLAVPEIVARFDYDTNLRRWDDFGPVHAVNYDLVKSAALHVPVLDAAGSRLRIPPTPQTNVSPPVGAIEVIRHITRAGYDYKLGPLLAQLRHNPPEALSDLLERCTMMGHALRQQFLTDLAPLNARLAENRGVVFADTLLDEPQDSFHCALPEKMIRNLAAASCEAAAK